MCYPGAPAGSVVPRGMLIFCWSLQGISHWHPCQQHCGPDKKYLVRLSLHRLFTNLSGFCCLYVAKPSPASPRAARKWPAAGACPGRLLHLSSLPQGLLSPPQHRIPLTSPFPPPCSATTTGAAWSQQPLPYWTPENTRQLNCPMLKPKQHTEQRIKQKMKQKR